MKLFGGGDKVFEKIYESTSSIIHFGIKGMHWGVRRSSSSRSESKSERHLSKRQISKRQIRKKNREQIRANAKDAKKVLAKQNDERILKEIDEYSKKTGKDYTRKFLQTYDDLEVWDLYSPEELELFNELESTGGFDEYKAR